MPEPGAAPSAELLEQLIELIDRLRDEASGFLDAPAYQQAWYNRGYANGMLRVLAERGCTAALGGRRPDPQEALEAHRFMPWGRAFTHGETMGRRETDEIIESEEP